VRSDRPWTAHLREMVHRPISRQWRHWPSCTADLCHLLRILHVSHNFFLSRARAHSLSLSVSLCLSQFLCATAHRQSSREKREQQREGMCKL
jgi:hypothetical protein